MNESNSNKPKEIVTLNQQIEEKKTAINNIDTWLKKHIKDEKLRDSFSDIEIEKLKVFRKELAEIAKKQKDYEKWSKRRTDAIAKKKTNISSLNKKITSSKNKVEENEKSLVKISKGKSIEQLHELRAEQQERVSDFQELYDLAGVNAKLTKTNFFSQFFAPKTADIEVTELKEESNLLQLELGKERNLVKILETAITNEMLLKKMEADRQHLVDGKPCFLCGSLDHLYTKHPPAVSNSKQVLVEQQKKTKELLTKAKKLEKLINAAEQQAEKDSNKENRLKLVRAQWRSLANKLNAATVDMKERSLQKDLLKVEKQEFSNITSLLKKYTRLEDTISQTKATLEVSEASVKRLSQELEEQKLEWENRPQESIEIEQIYKKQQADEKVLSEKIAKQLAVLEGKPPSKGEELALFNSLTKRGQEYHKYAEQKKSLIDEMKVLEAEEAK
ncbi:MAG: hypothetical protein KAH20_06145 [Methylococcales bacterium]|nr:hypothetical protein [Methylococcales bacterium]